MKKKLPAAALSGWLMLAAACGVPAERLQALAKKTDVAERKISNVEKGIAKSIDSYLASAEARLSEQLQQVRRSQAEVGAQVEELQANLARMAGEDESTGRGISAEAAQLKSEIEALKKRLDQLELLIIAGREPAGAAGPALPKMRSSRYLWPNDRAGYEDGRATYSKKNYTEAIDKLQEFLNLYPESQYRPDAHYYLGECFFSTGKYLEAIVQFGEIIQKYPGSSKLQIAYLRAGLAYKALGDKAKARLFLNKLLEIAPSGPLAAEAKKELRGL